MEQEGNNRVVGIIGAGVAGLCAVRHAQALEGWTPVVWEQAADLGGTWRVSQEIGTDSRGLPVHSSLYNSLRTDLPAVLMAFPDYKFPEGQSFMHHTVVLKYLEDYAHHFDLLPFIKFGHRVLEVSPDGALDGNTQWKVTVKDLSTSHMHTVTCHALLVCSGHFSEPSIPNIENIDKYLGKTLHSHDYREPSAYTGSTVVVLGAGASGLDISLELSGVADKVLLAHSLPLKIPSELPCNLHQVRTVANADEKGFVFADGTYSEADAIIYCTGYKYSFPFLMDDCGIQVKDNHVKDLYKHIINIRYPTMGFIGLPSRVIVFPLINYQKLKTMGCRREFPGIGHFSITSKAAKCCIPDCNYLYEPKSGSQLHSKPLLDHLKRKHPEQYKEAIDGDEKRQNSLKRKNELISAYFPTASDSSAKRLKQEVFEIQMNKEMVHHCAVEAVTVNGLPLSV